MIDRLAAALDQQQVSKPQINLISIWHGNRITEIYPLGCPGFYYN
ncbi:MAG: hypothetical protein R3C53_22180 [Pirellulaceae bacterium]